MDIRKFAAVAVLVSAGCGLLFADAKGDEIMQRTHDVKKPNFTKSQVIMTLTEKSGAQEVRQVLQYGRNRDDITSAVMDFKSPANIKDTRFLQMENKGRADDKWIYLPALKDVRRVDSSEGSKSFMGTDATYDDLSTREMEEDTHEYIKDETKNGFACSVVKNVPINPKSSQYSYRLVWVDNATDYPVYTELYDKKGKLIKVLTVKKIENHSGYNIPMEDLMENVQTGHKTSIKIIKIVVDEALPDGVFSQNFLRNGRP